MKKNGILIVIIVVLLMIISLMVGWYIGTNQGDKSLKVEENNNQNEVETNKTVTGDDNSTDEEDLSEYPEWIQYILNSEIKSIAIYKLMDTSDSNYKADKKSLYKVEITRDDLKEIFNSIKSGKMNVIAARGGEADYLRISYISDNKTYNLDFRQNYIDNNDKDEKLNDLLKKENSDIVKNLSETQKELFGSNPIPNAIEWNYNILNDYFNKEVAIPYYYDF